MASEDMVQELDRLRKLLDVDPADQVRQHASEATSSLDTAYAGALHAAEVPRTATYLMVTPTLRFE